MTPPTAPGPPILAMITGHLTPYRVSFYKRIVAEMQPLHSFLFRSPFVAAPVYLLAAVVGLTLVLRFRQYRLWEFALLGGLAMLANFAVRSLQDWVLIMLALGVPHFVAIVREARQLSRRHGVRRSLLTPRWLLRVGVSCRRILAAPAFRPQWVWHALAFGLLATV